MGTSFMQLALLVEQDCICLIEASQPMGVTERIDILNENDNLPLAYGLT